MKIIDIESWKRKEHFDLFFKMVSPFFGVVAEVIVLSVMIMLKVKGSHFSRHTFIDL